MLVLVRANALRRLRRETDGGVAAAAIRIVRVGRTTASGLSPEKLRCTWAAFVYRQKRFGSLTMSSVTGVIFDMDGVLVDSADAHCRAWQQLGEETGVPFTAELFRRTFGMRNASILPPWLGADPPPERAAQLGDRKEEIYRVLVRDGAVRVYPRVPEILDDLAASGARLAIASSGPRANVELLVEVTGARGRIEALVAAEDVRNGKPDPEAFLDAAQRLAVAPGRCAVVEDSTHGVTAAKRARMLAVAVLTSTPRSRLEEAGADVVIEEVGDLDAAELLAVLGGR
jgi:beta-phosphoglucomutase family hydrolase